MTANLPKVLQAIDSGQSASIATLQDFLRIPSVSTKPDHKPDMQRCAQWLTDKLRAAHLTADILPTKGHPVVLAKNAHQPNRPTVLLYGHYDVQPVEPLDLWTTPPFEPTVRNDSTGHPALFARGAVDDKGQVWAHLAAVTAWQTVGGANGLPINLTLLIEGEEEIGSEHLADFVHAHKAELQADIAVVSDTNQFARGLPAITYGLRGLVYMEVKVTTANTDLHSGLYGGTVPNAANVLTELLATLHKSDGAVNIEDFYTDVTPLTKEERADWAKLPFNEQAYLSDLSLTEPKGEPGYTTLERKWARPTCDINGLTSGYQGPGAKTVIPAIASAKVSMRLVPAQDPQKIVAAFEKTLRARCPKSVKLEVSCHSQTPAFLTPRTGQAMQLATEAVAEGFGVQPTLMREGGSIPVVALLKSALNLDTLLIGFGLPDDRVHAPNEKFDLDALHKATRTAAVLYERLSHLRS